MTGKWVPVLVLLGWLCAAATAADKPNILFIFADDQAFDTIHAHGNSEIETPNLDRLVARGVTFTHAYNQGGYHGAVCVASRTMLNTGRFLWNAQREEKEMKQKQADGLLWSQLLRKAGYQTFFTGKWHVKADTKVIFDVARNVRGGMPNQVPQGYNRPKDKNDDTWKPWDPQWGGFWKGGKHWSEVVGDDGVDFLKMAAENEKPFFMYLAFNAPHDPRQAPKEYVDKYPLNKISLPRPFLPEYPYQIGSNKIRDEKLAPFPRTEYNVKVNRQEYYAIITHMDAQIGRMLDALEKTGQADNTYIIFSADHGLAVGHHGLMGKQNVFDHSVRVPFMMVGPDIPKNKKIDTPIYMQDLMPTTLELAGIAKPDYVQFNSLLPVIKGGKGAYRAIYGAYTGTQRMVTEDHWKLILYPRIQQTLLYNLKKDPLEEKDLATNPEYASRITTLKKSLKALQVAVGDTLDLDQPTARAKKPKKKK